MEPSIEKEDLTNIIEKLHFNNPKLQGLIDVYVMLWLVNKGLTFSHAKKTYADLVRPGKETSINKHCVHYLFGPDSGYKFDERYNEGKILSDIENSKHYNLSQEDLRPFRELLTITRGPQYWIFQCNPNDYDFATAIKQNLLHDWTVAAHKDKIKTGDKAIVWLTGKQSGCYALADVTSNPMEVENPPLDPLWKTQPKGYTKVDIKITHSFLENPLLWQNIQNHKGLNGLKVGYRGTNFAATKEQYETLLQLYKNKLTAPMPPKTSYPLNQILYGPPGTGKTYHTVNRALEILGVDTNLPRTELKRIFDEKVKEGQIVFTTFHQCMSYEDFVEGIKPVSEKDSNNIYYQIKEGVFKYLADLSKFYKSIGWLKQSLPLKINMPSGNAQVVSVDDEAISVKRTTDNKLFRFILKEVEEDYQSILRGEKNLANVKQSKAEYGYLIEMLLNEKNRIRYILIIDEINRGNVSQIFGELITLIEEDKRLGREEALEVTLPYSKEKFGVPDNLYIIGTMNTADRSVEALDVALRRRFSFEEMPPRPELLHPARRFWQLLWDYEDFKWEDKAYSIAEETLLNWVGASQNLKDDRYGLWDRMAEEGKNEAQAQWFNESDFSGLRLDILLYTINNRIAYLLDKDHQIGHSYFMKVTSEVALREVFKKSIIPLLKEYFYNDYGKIRLVLGDDFVKEKDEDHRPKFAVDGGDLIPLRHTYELVPIDDNFPIIEALTNTINGKG